ncbi:TolC family protein [bacterium]|nr:TolC family protein [bacterium]MBU1025745.1 TolC family protein [bacterium]
MRKFTHKLFLVSVLLVFAGASAADDFNTLDYHQAVDIALKNNELVRAAEKMVGAARAEAKAQYAPFLPQLSTSYSYTRLDKAPSTTFDFGDGPESINLGTADNYEWSFNFVFPIYAGGAKSAAKKMIGINEEIAGNNLDIARRGISYGVTNTFMNALSAQHAVDVMKASHELTSQAYEEAVKWQEEGYFSGSEVLQMEVAMGRAEMQLNKAIDKEYSAKQSLAQLLGMESISSLQLDEPESAPASDEIDLLKILEIAKSKNSDIHGLELQIQMLKKRLELVKSGKRPSLNFVSNYTNQGDSPDVSGNGFNDPNTFTATLQLNWSIYDSKKISNEKKQLEDSISALEFQKKDAIEKLEIDLESSLNDYLRSMKNIKISKRNLESAEENFRILTERYREGLEKSLNLLDGEAMLTSARLDYKNSIFDSHTQLAKLAMLTGFETTVEFINSTIPFQLNPGIEPDNQR